MARLQFGKAASPKNAPLSVKRAIWAANQLRSKPYRYGGGDKSFADHNYDCSGTISYVLGAAGLISTPMSSTQFRSYGERGLGKWMTIYAREGHTFAVIAGLRLDPTPYNGYTGKRAPRWQTIYRPPRGFVQGTPWGCESTMLSAVLGGFVLGTRHADKMRSRHRTLQAMNREKLKSAQSFWKRNFSGA